MTHFKANCASCHATDFSANNSFHNNGLDDTFSEDSEQLAYGRGHTTRSVQDIGKFKTPFLRNIALTAPYMHDGRLSTLEEVLAHYTAGVKRSPTLAPQLRHNGNLGIPLTSEEQGKIVLFLHTLTDDAFTNNKAFANPGGL
jgi:cytochrome c peroxidase